MNSLNLDTESEELSIKQFAEVDAFVGATAVSSNLASFALVAMLPAFGTSGIAIAGFIMLAVSGILEIPTGWFADRFSWRLSLRLGFSLKIIVTLLMIAAASCAILDHKVSMWIFFSIEAIVDAFASTFVNGAYQSAFLSWFQSRHPKSTRPLFLAAYKYSFAIRIILPVIAITTGCICFWFSQKAALRTEIILAPLGFVLLLRFLTLFKAERLLLGFTQNLKNISNTRFLGSVIADIASAPCEFFALSFLNVLSMFVSMYFLPHFYQVLSHHGYLPSYVWSTGALVSLANFLALAIFGRVLYPKFSKFGITNSTLKGAALLCAFSAFCILLILNADSISLLQIICLATILPVLALSTDFIKRYMLSKLNHFVDQSHTATWTSATSLVGAAIAALALFAASILPDSGIAIMSYTALTASVLTAVVFIRAQGLFTQKTLSTRRLAKLAIGGIVFCFLLSIAGFEIASIWHKQQAARRDFIATMAQSVSETIREPLIQGASIEARARLSNLLKSDLIYCAQVLSPDLQVDLCDNKNTENNFLYSTIEKPIYFENAGTEILGTLRLYFSNRDIYLSIAESIFFVLVLTTIFGLSLHFLLNCFANYLERELSSILAGFAKTDASSKRRQSRLSEFAQIEIQLHNLIEQNAQNEKASALGEQARQVAHDIRSPLTAFNILMAIDGHLGAEERALAAGAVDRINAIANDLLERARPEPVSKQENIESAHILLYECLDSVVKEKQTQYSSRPGVQIDFSQYINPNLYVLAKKHDLGRILSNLINNAVEALKNGTGKIRIATRLSKGKTILIIEDDGIGIPEDILARLGTPGLSYGKGERGNGLGLSHAVRVLKEWGGDLKIYSKPGHGTHIEVHLIPA